MDLLSRTPQNVRIPVVVDWPELRLTAEQLELNAQAAIGGLPAPFPDLSHFDVVLEPTRDHPVWEPPDRPTWVDMEVVPTNLPTPPTDRRERPRRWSRRRDA